MKWEERVYKVNRRATLWLNGFRANYGFKKAGGKLHFLIPDRHRKTVMYLKYVFTIVGLLSAFIVFSSLVIAFVFGLAIWLISSLLERVAFRHPYLFVHPFPDFDLQTEKWVGCGFGYYATPEGEHILLVSMVLTDIEYAKNLARLFLSWTGGNYVDESKNINVSVVVLNDSEYTFFFGPSLKRPIAQRFFQSQKDKLRQKSLVDEVAEHQVTLTLGKRCHIGPGSYFNDFRARYREGVPVMFEFVLPPYDNPQTVKEIPKFVLFDIQIKNKNELTRKDMAYSIVSNYERGGTWQGPPELEPKK
jgi:hypothetical protein